MRYGIFSDVHSNLEAFEAVIEAYKKAKIDRYFCVGDIVGYGANPVECIQLVKGLNCDSVAGNHDVAAYDLAITEHFTTNARIAAEWAFNKLNHHHKDYLRSLKYTLEAEGFILVHGSLDRPEDFSYIFDISGARNNFEFQKKPICFVGHSHVPGIFRKSALGLELMDSFSAKIEDNSMYLVNVGSVGQPRDFDNRASYCILDADKKTIEIKRTAYNIEAASEKIIQAGLPTRLAERLFTGS